VRIAFVSLFKEGYGGGEGRVAHEMAHRLAVQHDVVIICPHERTTLYRCPDGLKVFGVKSAGEGNVCVPILTSKQVKAILDFLDSFAPEIVHAHEPVSISLIGQIWARMHRVPFVHTAHVLPSRAMAFGAIDVLKVLNGPLTHSVARRALEDFFRNCDAIVALNRSVAQDLEAFGYRGRILKIPNGRDLHVYAACRYADVDAPVKVLTFTGFISRRKNQLYLLHVLHHLGFGYRLQLLGDAIDRAYREELERTIRDLELEHVALVGQVDHADVPRYLEGTHAFISASKLEVQSLSVIEALASGTPVVGLSNETVDELVDDAVGRRLPQDAAPAAFAGAVRAVCEQPSASYVAMCQSARERVRHLDWDNVLDMTLDAYRSLLAQQPPTQDRSRQLADLIGWVPSEDVRRFLYKHLKVPRVRLAPLSTSNPKWSGLQRVSGRTWFLVGLTVVASRVVGLMLRRSSLGDKVKSLRSMLNSLSRRARSSFNDLYR